MASRIGNSIFFIGMILLVPAAMAGMPLMLPIGSLALLLMVLGGWLWLKYAEKSVNNNQSLSRQPAKYKVFVGVPALILIFASLFTEQQNALISGTGMFLLAYAIVGLIELLIDKRAPNAKQSWESISSWGRFFISTFVIVLALVVFIGAIPYMAKIIY